MVLGEVVVVAGGGEGAGNAKDDNLLALERVSAKDLGDPAGVLEFGVVWAISGKGVRRRRVLVGFGWMVVTLVV